jgi:hypothetical protein
MMHTVPWSGQATHAVAGQLERVVRLHRAATASGAQEYR